MNTIEELHNIDSETKAFWEGLKDDINASKFKIKFPYTFNMLISYNAKIESISKAMYACYDIGSYTSLFILFRSLVEHELRANYVYLNWGKFKNDTIAEEYFRNLEAYEKEVQCNALKFSNKNLNSNYHIEGLTSPEQKSYSEEVKKYSYKNIVRFIANTISMQDFAYFRGIVYQYTNLSSYVHGGLNQSDAEIEENIATNEDIGEYLQVSTQANFYGKKKLLILLMNLEPVKFIKSYDELSAIEGNFK